MYYVVLEYACTKWYPRELTSQLDVADAHGWPMGFDDVIELWNSITYMCFDFKKNEDMGRLIDLFKAMQWVNSLVWL